MVKLATKTMMIVGALMAMTSTTQAGILNPHIDGVTGPDVEVVNGNIMMTMVFNNVAVDGGATIPIKKFPNSSIQVGPDFQSAGTLLVLTINIKDFAGGGGKSFNPKTLPGGRPLPSVAAGSLPALAIKVPQLFNSVFYVGPNVVGFFVPFKLNLGGAILTFRFYDKADKPIGIIALVGKDSRGKNSGFLALLSMNLVGLPAVL